jgi:hypothetical protein
MLSIKKNFSKKRGIVLSSNEIVCIIINKILYAEFRKQNSQGMGKMDKSSTQSSRMRLNEHNKYPPASAPGGLLCVNPSPKKNTNKANCIVMRSACCVLRGII